MSIAKKISAELRSHITTGSQLQVIELMLEGMTEADIASQGGWTTESVRKWSLGARPSVVNAAGLEKLHEQLMYLKSKGILFAEIRASGRYIRLAYDQFKAKVKAA